MRKTINELPRLSDIQPDDMIKVMHSATRTGDVAEYAVYWAEFVQMIKDEIVRQGGEVK